MRALIARFASTQADNPAEHLRIVDDPNFHRQVPWLKRHRRDLWDQLRPVILASWHRVYPQTEQRAHARRVAEDMVQRQRFQRREPR